MPSRYWVAALLPLLLAPPVEDATYEAVFQALRQVTAREDRVATVRDLVVRRDVAEFRLAEGTLYLLTPVGGRTVGAAFVGSGSVVFRPPLPIERGHLHRVLGDSTLDAPLTSAAFFFADSTLAELERAVTFAPGKVDGAVAGRVSDALDFLVDGRERRAAPTLMAALLNGDANGFFAAYIKRPRGEDVMVQVDPHLAEEVLLLRRGRRPGQRIQTVCQFQRAADLRAGVAEANEHPEPLTVAAYRIEASIRKNLDFSATATLTVTGRRSGVRWAPFLLFDELGVDSVIGEGGARLGFFRADGTAPLWVRFDPALDSGQTQSVNIAYHGDLIDFGSVMEQFLPPRTDPRRAQMVLALDTWPFVKATETWFPRYSFRQPADMELVFQTPRSYRFAAIGQLVDSQVNGDVLTTRWVTERPTMQASFSIGDFDEVQVNDPRIPPVTVHVNREAHGRLREMFFGQRDPGDWVAQDMANSLAFFTNVFGPPLFRRYYATEIPYFHGQAFPGLIHLSWWTFQTLDQEGEEETFRAHEMAHQWWGIGVEPAGVRDVWLSEGFSEFAGLWYMQLMLRDNEKYFKQLRDWRKRIRSVRKDAPPLGLGYRLAEGHPEHYDLIVYKKGAWVLHMLRNMMIDFRTMDEGKFTAMMRDFYGSHRGGFASTKDFEDLVERHFGMPMGWFFEQWVHGTAVPTYVFSWRVEPTPDGRHLLKLRVRQDDVPPGFIMPVPLMIEFAEGGPSYVRVNVRGALTEAELILPEAPTRLEFNPLESVLAEVKLERWR